MFILSILSFVWRTGSVVDPTERPPLGVHAALGPRIAVTGVFVLGMVYFALIVKALRRYGTHPGARGAAGRTRPGAAPGRNAGAGAVSDRPRAGDVDAAMERRGRERERSAQRTPRREGSIERRDGARDVDAAEKAKESNPLKALLGLGLTAPGSRDHDSGIGLGLEKGDEETDVVGDSKSWTRSRSH